MQNLNWVRNDDWLVSNSDALEILLGFCSYSTSNLNTQQIKFKPTENNTFFHQFRFSPRDSECQEPTRPSSDHTIKNPFYIFAF